MSAALIAGYCYMTHENVSKPRLEWQKLMTHFRRRAEGGETYLHHKDGGGIAYEIYANVPAPDYGPDGEPK